ncbi:XamI family restriction endonuclease [Chroococcidiopsis thermalis]|uniref:Type II site-specific deoxyribonuclease n=1 Tax=Chroococcidiopsis thermalis (strain PCC 7203) TaxID=251229 RepID=K9U9Q7_CHRTP|nr:XamI family restriction endonuclease [Chroococcidiopsis thermalis]AFY90994.1 Type II site-specific deoxyribonuclease [Chroococcidiopsis thermalis PCC 7203]
MAVNCDKPDRWKVDIAQSVDMYNTWFVNFAPQAFRETRVKVTQVVASTLQATNNLKNLQPEILRQNPSILPTLRMCTCPPIARDRLIGLAGVAKSVVERMEVEGKLPVRLTGDRLDEQLRKITNIVSRLADRDIFTWLDTEQKPTESEIYRAATIVADRLCGSSADPIVRNAQEARQLREIAAWLNRRGYRLLPADRRVRFDEMLPGTYSFRLNIPVNLSSEDGKTVNIPVDAVIMRNTARRGDRPLLVEAKSAGDFTNVNKRRKEEARKIQQLQATYGNTIEFVLFLCGYFDSGYLGYEAAEGIDWVWEHRIDDLAEFGL